MEYHEMAKKKASEEAYFLKTGSGVWVADETIHLTAIIH